MEPKAYSYIRFSSPEQLKGDSLRRQKKLIEEAEQWVKQNTDLVMDKDTMIDSGLSGWKGFNRTKGALGAFLQKVEKGEIVKGSMLIVEHMDRLTRERVTIALSMFLSLISAGIRLVTLKDKHEYTLEKINKDPNQLIISITYMMLANLESERKSQLLKDTWENKRNNIHSKIITGKIPKWLKRSEDKKSLIPIPEAAEAINRIFLMKANGETTYKIEKEMIRDADVWKPPKWSKNESGGWRRSYIDKILGDRAVIGEYQPHVMVSEDEHTEGRKNQRKPIGKVITDYYPAIVDRDLFQRVQKIRQDNKTLKGQGGGRIGRIANLFTHIVKCGYCGSTMEWSNKGKPPKGAEYLFCDASRRELKDENGNRICNTRRIRYDEFEKIVLSEMDEIKVSDLTDKRSDIDKKLSSIKSSIIARQQDKKDLIQEGNNLKKSIRLLTDESTREDLNYDLIQVNKEKQQLELTIKQLEQQFFDLDQLNKTKLKSLTETKEIINLLEQATDEEQRIKLRMKLRSILRQLILKIKVYPLMEPYVRAQLMDPYTLQTMHSKFIDRIFIDFHQKSKWRIIPLKRQGDIEK